MDRSEQESDMHRRVSWMKAVDESILMFLYSARDAFENPSIQSPQTIAANTGYSRNYVGNACRSLADRGLLIREGHGLYRLSEQGEALMDGGISPEEFDTTED